MCNPTARVATVLYNHRCPSCVVLITSTHAFLRHWLVIRTFKYVCPMTALGPIAEPRCLRVILNMWLQARYDTAFSSTHTQDVWNKSRIFYKYETLHFLSLEFERHLTAREGARSCPNAIFTTAGVMFRKEFRCLLHPTFDLVYLFEQIVIDLLVHNRIELVSRM